MPTTKSAIKWVKTSKQRHDRSKAAKTRITTTRRKLYDAIRSGDKAKCEEVFHKYCSFLDKAVKKGAIKANAASRRKSRATARIASI